MLFDTDVLIWALRGSKKAAKEIDNDENRFISAVSYMELMQCGRNKQEQILLRQFLNELGFAVFPITDAISHRTLILAEEHALQSGIRLANALVFAAACKHSLTRCSVNDKHFRNIRPLDLKVFRPEKS